MVTKKDILFIVNETIKFYGIDESVKPTKEEKEVLANQIFEKILDEITDEMWM